MFRKMLVCSDLSPSSDSLIHSVSSLKSVGTQEIVLVHVIHVADAPGFEDVQIADVKQGLDRQRQMLEQHDTKVTVETPLGLPARTINELAAKHDASAILITSHGKGIIRSATLGSVSSEVLHHSRHPVLMLRSELLTEGKSERVCSKMFQQVLLPTDFSKTAELALDYLGKIALETNCPVTLLHVIADKSHDPAAAREAEEEATYLLEAKQRRLRTLGAAEVTIELVHGKPAEEIISRTQSGKYSIAVMGGQGKGLLQEFILGSTANEVARHAGVPLLFIPAEG
jgi:nucleotide-binding universal stress UspA family protein